MLQGESRESIVSASSSEPFTYTACRWTSAAPESGYQARFQRARLTFVDPRDEITEVLRELRGGDSRAWDVLLPLVYDELRAIAVARVGRERPDHTWQATDLVHEAYLRVQNNQQMDWQSRGHFLAVASTAMRRLLVDHARARGAQKRGGGQQKLPLDEVCILPGRPMIDVLALDEALEKLAAQSPSRARMIELTYFGGLNGREVADVLGVTQRSVERGLRYARAFLTSLLVDGTSGSE